MRCDNTAAVAMLNKGTTRHPVMMQLLRMLFWLSAIHIFRLKAFHIPGAENFVADHASRLHETRHFCSFYNFLASYSMPFTASALNHMSVATYRFLIGKYLTLG